ncbi:hydroxyacid dehydrogenase [Bifidobacterium primatium]|uniref:Hydroxyacid dehydrogenase n=2 Tax=Bifidobacterium TaxID=1678 RepID=A0A2M9HAF0_9BIFI|nr:MULTISPECIES: D-2-hydroxyacid dehydrogenase [Bifidobacterium]NEG96535.1 D-2-hydroxyacid dehydrogenase [Bifidobacterium sp. SMB2]NEH10548.1 D-2-hydroxyacid dehydrogenase [Bifidobacterium saimiriisciurei]NEH10669.1 D-2-hydroxyacid dehydrogenase [Bifidobacterium saimiriisciurei]PJM73771.1 hydroxyacid dehydrogenase [Bifidobacterium primatium]
MTTATATNETGHKLRVVVAVPLKEELCKLVETLEPRVEMVRDQSLLKPMRCAADWSGDPEYHRTEEQQKAFDELVDSAEVLFGIPDVEPAALARTVRANPDLKWVMTTAAGGGSQVKDAGLAREEFDRIIFTTSAGVHGGPLAEFAVFGLLAGAKNLPKLLADKQAKNWPGRWEMRQVDEMTVLVMGLGGIGSECVRRLNALGARVIGVAEGSPRIDGVDKVVTAAELPQVVGEADAIINTLPGTDQTFHMLGKDVFANMKPGTIISSVGRGTVIDESELLKALDDGRVAFAAMDVFEHEPLPADSPFWTHPQVVVSPHTAALSSKEEERIARRFAQDATAFLDGKPLRAVVNTVEFY